MKRSQSVSLVLAMSFAFPMITGCPDVDGCVPPFEVNSTGDAADEFAGDGVFVEVGSPTLELELDVSGNGGWGIRVEDGSVNILDGFGENAGHGIEATGAVTVESGFLCDNTGDAVVAGGGIDLGSTELICP
jgi:hypothetical protein